MKDKAKSKTQAKARRQQAAKKLDLPSPNRNVDVPRGLLL